jgi:cytochrome bd ubiquinol oxidase subunit II
MTMVTFWVALLAISILIYLLLDGFDLGVGILFLLPNSEPRRRAMQGAIAPFWDGNETWLVVTGVILWGAFPVVYATVLSAFYIPVILMLLGLILRGVAFEFRNKSQQWRWIWNLSFGGGSLVATFMQGAMVGSLVQGLPMANGEYTGGTFGWFSAFSVLCGIGLCLGYALLGACWLVRKRGGAARDVARRQIPVLATGVLLFLILVFSHALIENLPILHRWIDRPYLFVFPAIGAAAACVLASSILRHDDYWPFLMVSLIFVTAFGTLALSFWPYMVPFTITIDQAAAPHSSLAFMFWGEGLFVFPLMLLYTATGFRVFRGKFTSAPGHY